MNWSMPIFASACAGSADVAGKWVDKGVIAGAF